MSDQVDTLPVSAVPTSGTQYAVKKRKRPQPRTKNDGKREHKSNPSKRHRDRLNAELERLSSLIPFPTEVINKLDKLSILRLAVAYMRNKNYHAAMSGASSNASLPKDFFNDLPNVAEVGVKSLDGFLIVITQDFNVFYITSTVQDYLGYPQSDIINQTMIDYIHTDDRQRFVQQMQVDINKETDVKAIEDGTDTTVPNYTQSGYTQEVFNALSEDGLLNRSFICRLRCLLDTSSGFLALHFTGHLKTIPGQVQRTENGKLLAPEVGLFLMATPLQTPSILEIRTKNFIFQTRHELDYQPVGIDANGQIVLGYTEYELCQQSGYQFVHSADMMHCADAHTKLMKCGESGLTIFRLLHRAKRWQWVTATARLSYSKGKPQHIIVTHRAITDQEGEEHLTTRISAFKFDFTGQAILYDDNGGPPAPPPQNVVDNGKLKVDEAQTINPTTLHGAKMLQKPEIYEEPPRKIHDYMHSEYLFPEISIVKSETSNSSNEGEISLADLFFNTPTPKLDATAEDLILSPSDFSPISTDSGIQSSGSNKSGKEEEPPRLHHSPLYASSGVSSNSPENRDQLILKDEYNMPLSKGIPTSNGNAAAIKHISHNGHPDTTYVNQQQQQQQYANDYQQPGYVQTNPTLGWNNQQPIQHIPSTTMYQQQQQQQQQQPNVTKYNSYQQLQTNHMQNPQNNQISSYATNYGASHNTDDMGILNSLDITSSRQMASTQEREQFLRSKGVQEITSGQQDSLNIEFQENLIHFNLDNIAAHYQTSNPMQVLQEYILKNPKAALSITRGFVPEANLTTEFEDQPMPTEEQYSQQNEYFQQFMEQHNQRGQNSHMQSQQPHMDNNMEHQPHMDNNMEHQPQYQGNMHMQHPYSGKLNQNHPGNLQEPYPGMVRPTHPGKMQQPHPGKMQQPHPGKMKQPHPGKMQQPHPGKMQQPHPGMMQQNLPGTVQDLHPGKIHQNHPGKLQQQQHNNQQYQNW